jgi:hypothetical protein
MYDNSLSIPNQVYWVTPGEGALEEINLGNGCNINGPYIFTDASGAAHDMNIESSNAVLYQES